MGGSGGEEQGALKLEIVRVHDAPRARVFAMWTEPAHLDSWCRPKGFTVVDSGGDIRPGGAWHSRLRGPDGSECPLEGTFLEVEDGDASSTRTSGPARAGSPDTKRP